jgi:hypothetical protein
MLRFGLFHLRGVVAREQAREAKPSIDVPEIASMHSFLIAGAFILMVLSPCLVTLRWHPEKDDDWD